MHLAFTNGMAISVAKVKNSQKIAETSWEICSRHRGKISTKQSFSDAKTSKLQTGYSPRRRRKSELRDFAAIRIFTPKDRSQPKADISSGTLQISRDEEYEK